MHIYRPDDNRATRPILYFHAMARLGMEGLLLVEPANHFVSLGMFDNLLGAIDRDACEQRNIPIMRREVGGGTVLLGPGQTFYNIVLRRDRRRVPQRISEACELLSQIPMATYQALGLDVRYRPLTDLITPQQRKISGQGSADIEGCFCFVGNIIHRFDTHLMSQLFPHGGESERALVQQALDENMSWLERELGRSIDHVTISEALIQAFRQQFGPVTEHPLPEEVWELALELEVEFSSEETLLLESNRSHSSLKIREGIYLHRHTLAIEGEHYRLVLLEKEGEISEVQIYGEGSLLNTESLQLALQHTSYDIDALKSAIHNGCSHPFTLL